MKEQPKRGAAYAAVRFIYNRSPGKSWRRLNGALFETLNAAITAHLSFEPDDFNAICKDMNGGYWMGNSSGSTCGEMLYSHMVKVAHTPACISFERYAERPAALWVEDVKTPGRLCIGSRFTWNGLRVEVTNMFKDRLIACYYENRIERSEQIEVGDGVYIDSGYRRVDAVDRTTWAPRIVVRFGEATTQTDNRNPTKRFTIPYTELALRRKQFDATRKAALKKIEAAASEEELDATLKALSEAGATAYRRYDESEIMDAMKQRRKSIKDAGK